MSIPGQAGTMIVHYLSTLWRTGILQGVKQEVALYMSTGPVNMQTPADVPGGRVSGREGVAVAHPAAFNFFCFSHMTIPY